MPGPSLRLPHPYSSLVPLEDSEVEEDAADGAEQPEQQRSLTQPEPVSSSHHRRRRRRRSSTASRGSSHHRSSHHRKRKRKRRRRAEGRSHSNHHRHSNHHHRRSSHRTCQISRRRARPSDEWIHNTIDENRLPTPTSSPSINYLNTHHQQRSLHAVHHAWQPAGLHYVPANHRQDTTSTTPAQSARPASASLVPRATPLHTNRSLHVPGRHRTSSRHHHVPGVSRPGTASPRIEEVMEHDHIDNSASETDTSHLWRREAVSATQSGAGIDVDSRRKNVIVAEMRRRISVIPFRNRPVPLTDDIAVLAQELKLRLASQAPILEEQVDRTTGQVHIQARDIHDVNGSARFSVPIIHVHRDQDWSLVGTSIISINP